MNTDNRRVRMTKQMIKDSFIELLQTKNINQITVRELCNLADINRTTFYKYYDDPYDLLHKMEEEMLEQLDFYLGNNDSNDARPFINTLQFLADNRRLVLFFFTFSQDKDLPQKLLRLPAVVNSLNDKIKLDSLSQAYIEDYIIYGSFRIITRWLKSDCPETPETIANLIHELNQKICN